MARSHPGRLIAAQWLSTWTLLAVAAPQGAAAPVDTGLSFGGNVAATTDYIYRGVSESDGRAALQADLHAETRGGTYAGVWGSTRDRSLDPGSRYDFDLYLGHRIELNGAWSASLTARSHSFVGDGEPSDDYQELSGAVSWLDRWTVSLSAIPNAVRYWYFRRTTRSPAWAADTSGQWLLGRGLFITAAAGYYRSTGTGPGMLAATGYGYGNAGVAYVHGGWRLDVGYFVTDTTSEEVFPYPISNRHFASTLSWHF